MQGASNNTFNLQSSHPGSSETNSSNNARSADNDEFVVKDKNGSYKLDIPVLPPVIVGENGEEIEGFDDGQNGGGSGSTVVDSAGETDLGGREKERIEASLIEMMCRNRNRQMSGEPAEIYNLIQQSLRNKVAALEEDNWMYEPEIEPRV